MATGWPQKPPLGSPVDRNHPLARNLVAYWLMNEAGSATIRSCLGYPPLIGTLANGTVWTDGATGPALLYGGGDDTVTLGLNILGPLLNGAPAITIVSWVYPMTIDATGHRVIDEIINSTNATGFLLGLIGSDEIILAARSGLGDALQSFTTTTSPVILNAPNCVAGVIDYPRDTLTVYHNGRAVGTSSVTFGGSTYTHGVPSSWVDCIGNRGDGLRGFTGRIETVLLFNRDLNPGELAYLYHNPFGLIARPRIELWAAVTEEVPTIVPCPYYWHMMAG